MTLFPSRFGLTAARSIASRVCAMALAPWIPFGALPSVAADFMVTTPGDVFAYTINGAAPNPTVTLVRGQTYTFEVETCSCHPFELIQQATTTPIPGVVNNNISSGTLTFTVPADPINYRYWCSIHAFKGNITTVAAAAPFATTQAATGVGVSSSTFNATVHPNGAATTVVFIYGTSPTLASGTTTTAEQTISEGSMSVGVNLVVAGLSSDTVYYYRVQATNATGPTLGGIRSFTTEQGPMAEIAVFNGEGTAPGNARTDNAAPFALATTPVGGSSVAQTFTIQNAGGEDLTDLAVTKKAGGHEGDFTLDVSTLESTLTAGATTSFTVTFSPTVEGVRNAVLEIASNDANENPFEIPLTGRTHVVSFVAESQSQIENAIALKIPVQISAAAGLAFTVPVSFTGGTATDGTDFTHSASPLSFTAAQTVANVTLTVKENALVTGNRTVVINLGTPSAAGVILGTQTTFTLTIVEDDEAPVIDPDPISQIVAVGDAVSFVSGATGSAPLALQWKKNGKAIGGATEDHFELAAVALEDAGAYTMTATNTRAAKTSAVAQLAVVDDAAGIVRADVGTTASVVLKAGGNSLLYRWRKGAMPLDNDAKYAGVTTKTLKVKGITLEDAGVFSCLVTGPGGELAGGDQTLQVPGAEPIAVQPVLPDTVVYNAYSYQLPFNTDADKAPTKFVCENLPKGLTCNATTGLIFGKATTPGTYTITVTLSNAEGSADPVEDTMVVREFPAGAMGTFVGIVSADPAVNAELGGRIDLTTTAKGSFSGALKFGAAKHALKGSAVTAPAEGAHPQVNLTLPRTGKAPLQVELDLDPEGDALSGNVKVKGEATAANVAGWRNKWRTTAPANAVTGQLGAHAFQLEPDGDDAGNASVPQGYSFGTIAVTAAGVTTVKGRLADGGSLLIAGLLGPEGEVLFYQPLNANQGSLLGAIQIATDPDHAIGGALDWKKNAQGPSPRDYLPFGPVVLNAFGGRYSVSKPVLGLPVTDSGVNNAQLIFSEAGIGDSNTNPNVEFRISDKNVAAMPPIGALNEGKITSLALAAAVGSFSGKFTLTDDGAAPRTVKFQGQLVPTLGKGYGWFLLPASSDSTSPILSGRVILEGLQ